MRVHAAAGAGAAAAAAAAGVSLHLSRRRQRRLLRMSALHLCACVQACATVVLLLLSRWSSFIRTRRKAEEQWRRRRLQQQQQQPAGQVRSERQVHVQRQKRVTGFGPRKLSYCSAVSFPPPSDTEPAAIPPICIYCPRKARLGLGVRV